MVANDPSSRPNPQSSRTWDQEDAWWRSNFSSRPYVRSGRDYDYYRPGYRYGYESGAHHMGRRWDEVEADLRTGWSKYQHRGPSAWDEIKDAVRDAWHRVTGQEDAAARSTNPSGRAGDRTR